MTLQEHRKEHRYNDTTPENTDLQAFFSCALLAAPSNPIFCVLCGPRSEVKCAFSAKQK